MDVKYVGVFALGVLIALIPLGWLLLQSQSNASACQGYVQAMAQKSKVEAPAK